MSSGVFQLNVFLDSWIAMFLLGEGAVGYLYFGNRLLQFPMALIGHGVTTVAFPEMSRRAAQGWSATAEFLRDAARLQAFWLLPAAVGLIVCAEPLVRTIYQTGQFGDDDVARTVLVTQFLGLSLVPISLSKLLVRAFHAHQDQRTPLRVSVAMVAVNLVLNLTLVFTPLHEAGLALATAISGTGGFLTYLILLHRRGATALLDVRGLLRPALAALAMGLAVAALFHHWPQPEGRASGYAALRLLAGVALGGAVYLAITGTGWLRRRKATASPADPPRAESPDVP
jgi:putative peptidoglycan lipid II flippase